MQRTTYACWLAVAAACHGSSSHGHEVKATAPAAPGDAAATEPSSTDVVKELRDLEAEIVARWGRLDHNLQWHAVRVEKADTASRATVTQAAREYLRAFRKIVEQDGSSSAFHTLCDAGDLPACEILGGFVKQNAIGDAERAKALPYFRRACDGGAIEGCFSLGVTLWDSERKTAEPILERVCDQGHGEACTWYASAIAYEDTKRGLSLFKRACELTSSMGCATVGNYYEHGLHGTPKDAALAQTAYQRSCDIGGPYGCYELVDLLRKQKADPARIEAVLAHACKVSWAEKECVGVIPRPPTP